MSNLIFTLILIIFAESIKISSSSVNKLTQQLMRAIRLSHKLKSKHVRTLRILVRLSKKFRYVPISVLSSNMGVKSSLARRILQYLVENKLVDKKKTSYEGYAITPLGLDTLALTILSKRAGIEEITTRLDVGKEADIHICRVGDEHYILKVFRLGRTSFKKVRAVRPGYEGGRRGWISINIRAAAKEYSVLQSLWSKGISVPAPVARAYHMILMEYVPGTELIKLRLQNPIKIFRMIIEETIKAVYIGGIVHADLSEYNILVSPNEDKIWIIDWPQWLSRLHPEAMDYLEKDINRIVFYFRRKYKLPEDELWGYIEEIRNKYKEEISGESHE